MRRSARVALSLILLSILLASCTRAAGSAAGPGVVSENKPFPRLQGKTLDGTELDTATMIGKPFVLNVWATWCGPCALEQPALQKLSLRYAGRMAFLGINYRDDSAAAAEWVRQFGVPYPSLSDPSGRFAVDLGFPALPDTYIVDATGTIRFAVFGQSDEQLLAGLIDRVLGTTPSASP